MNGFTPYNTQVDQPFELVQTDDTSDYAQQVMLSWKQLNGTDEQDDEQENI